MKDMITDAVHTLRSRLKPAAAARSAPAREIDYLSRIEATVDSLLSVPVADHLRQSLKLDDLEALNCPNVSEIEINDSCNLDCVMCKTSLSRRAKGLMDLSLFEQVVARLAENEMFTTSLHTIGDPLANRNLGKYFEILRRYGMTVKNLSSNCLLVERHLDTIFEYRDIITKFRPSIDAASKEVYERIRVGGKWEDLHRNLHLFAERNAAANNPFPVQVNNIVSKDNYNELALIPHVFSFLCPTDNFLFGFVNSLSPTNDYFMNANFFEGNYLQNKPCHMPFNSAFILKEGDVSLCCRDYHGEIILGNVKDWKERGSPWKDGIDNERLQAIRAAHLGGRAEDMPALCRSCYMIDPRLSELLSDVIRFFYKAGGKDPSVLQDFLNLSAGDLRGGDYLAYLTKVKSLV
jgi:hypothetical protein